MFLDLGLTNLGQGDGAVFLVDLVILGAQLLDHLGHAVIGLSIVVGWAGDDQGGAGFVD